MSDAPNNSAAPVGIISDLLLWLAIALLAGLGFAGWQSAQPHGEVIALKFNDANEISRGAMVRMMGTEIGFVDKVEVQQDAVHLVIRTYPDALPIPSGSVASILFTGLAGSKSVEINPPNIPRPARNGKKRIIAEDPVRLKDMFNYQMDVTQAMQRGAENISDFFGKKKPVEELQFNIQTSHRKIANAGALLANGNRNIQAIENNLHQGLTQISQTAHDMNSAVVDARHITRPEKMDAAFGAALNQFTLGFLEGQAVLVGFRVNNTLQKLNGQTALVSSGLVRSRMALEGVPFAAQVDAFSHKNEAFYLWTRRIDDPVDVLPAMKQTRQGIQTWGERFQHWSDAVIRATGGGTPVQPTP